MDCRTAKPKNLRYQLSDKKGLYLQIMPTGAKFWRIKYWLLGQQKLFTIGQYPEISLLKAREEANTIQSQVKSGICPIIERKNQLIETKRQANETFMLIALEWHTVNLPQWQARYAATLLHRLKKYVFPELGNLPMQLIKSSTVLECLKKIDETALEMARRIKQLISRIFMFAIATDRAETDVTISLKHALKKYKKGRYHSLDIDLLPKFLFDIYESKAKLHAQTYLALKFMMLTFVRTQEMVYAKWNEIDFEKALWVIPAERMKMKQTHIVPLSKQAIGILMTLKELNGKREYVFASIPRPRIPMSKGTVLVAIKRLGYCGLMTGHGFRALALGVLKEKLKYPHDIADRQLAHAPKSTVDRAYDRAKFLDDRIVMMQKYADYLDKVLATERIKNAPTLSQIKTKPVLSQDFHLIAHIPKQNMSMSYSFELKVYALPLKTHYSLYS